jgi:hypothetical protein
MAVSVKLRRGTATEHNSFTGNQSEVTHDTTNNRLRLHDGATPGGIPLARLDEIKPGTVTSIAVTVPTGFGVGGSPISGSGTFAITYSVGFQGYTTAEATKLAGIAAGATVNSPDAALLARANHTGTQAISTVSGLQAALDAKAPLASPVFTGTIDYGTLT